MANVLGICNLHDNPRLGPLTENRPLGAVTFLGRYGLIDFALSNFSNSHIDRIAVLVKNNFLSIRTHVGTGQAWVNNTKTGFIRLLINEKAINNYKFNTDVTNIKENTLFFEDEKFDYVLITNPFFLMSCDYRDIVNEHIKSGNDVTMVYKNVKNADKEFINCDELVINNGKVKDVRTNVGNEKKANISLETYVISRDFFRTLINSCKDISASFSLRKLLSYYIEKKIGNIGYYEFDGEVIPMLDLEHYIRYSFSLLDYKERALLFKPEWPIYTTTHNTPPAIYGKNSKVKNSFIANGSIVKGTIENSIISRDVTIEEGAVIKNCILFTGTKVGKNNHLTYVIADKKSDIRINKDLYGSEKEMMFVHLGEKI